MKKVYCITILLLMCLSTIQSQILNVADLNMVDPIPQVLPNKDKDPINYVSMFTVVRTTDQFGVNEQMQETTISLKPGSITIKDRGRKWDEPILQQRTALQSVHLVTTKSGQYKFYIVGDILAAVNLERTDGVLKYYYNPCMTQ